MFPTMRMLASATGESQLEAAKKDLLDCFAVLQSELGDQTYFGGETFGFADVTLIPFYSWFYVVEMRGKLSLEDLFPKLVDWGKRCCLRESVSQSLPDPKKLYEFFLRRIEGAQKQ